MMKSKGARDSFLFFQPKLHNRSIRKFSQRKMNQGRYECCKNDALRTLDKMYLIAKRDKKGTVPFLSISYTFPFAFFHRKKKMGNLSKEEAREPKRLEEKKGYDTDFFL